MSPEIVKLLLQGVEETIFMVAVSGCLLYTSDAADE